MEVAGRFTGTYLVDLNRFISSLIFQKLPNQPGEFRAPSSFFTSTNESLHSNESIGNLLISTSARFDALRMMFGGAITVAVDRSMEME